VPWIDVTSAISTAAAALVALGLGLRAEWRAIRSERHQAEIDERRQAIHVAAWALVERHREEGRTEVDPSDPSLDTLSASFDMHGIHIYSIIQNASEEPIWDVTTRVPGFVPKSRDSNELKPTTLEDEYVVIGPRETVKREVTAATLAFNRLPIEIDFRDNAGQDWRRDDRGRLHQGRKEPPSWAWIDELEREKGHSLSREPERRLPSAGRVSQFLRAKLSTRRRLRRQRPIAGWERRCPQR